MRYPIVIDNPLGHGGGGHDDGPTFFLAGGCASICVSPISQEDADLCAQRQADLCAHSGGGGDDGGGVLTGVFFNNLESCSWTCPDGSLFTWFVSPGTFFAPNQPTADAMAQAYACRQAAAHFFCMGALTPITTKVLVPYSGSILISGINPGPFSASVVAGNLPPGILMAQSLDSKTILLSGTPTASGVFNFTIRATDPGGNLIQKAFTLTVTSNCPGLFAGLAWVPAGINPAGTSIIQVRNQNVFHLAGLTNAGNPSSCSAEFDSFVNPLTTDSFACQVILTVNADIFGNLTNEVLIEFDDSITFATYLSVDLFNPAPGTYTYNVNIPAGASLIGFVEVIARASAFVNNFIDVTITLGI